MFRQKKKEKKEDTRGFLSVLQGLLASSPLPSNSWNELPQQQQWLDGVVHLRTLCCFSTNVI